MYVLIHVCVCLCVCKIPQDTDTEWILNNYSLLGSPCLFHGYSIYSLHFLHKKQNTDITVLGHCADPSLMEGKLAEPGKSPERMACGHSKAINHKTIFQQPQLQVFFFFFFLIYSFKQLFLTASHCFSLRKLFHCIIALASSEIFLNVQFKLQHFSVSGHCSLLHYH